MCQYGKQLQCNYQLSKSTPRGLERKPSRLADGKVSPDAAGDDTQQPLLQLCNRECCCVQSKSEASLVAMDFSGKAGGRVIQNPTEAQSAELEEGQAWRVSHLPGQRRHPTRSVTFPFPPSQRREALRCSLPNLNSNTRPSCKSIREETRSRSDTSAAASSHACFLSAAVHRSQPWFHGGVSRTEAQRLIEKQGLVDGSVPHSDWTVQVYLIKWPD